MEQNIPAGYWKDAEGRLIPESMIKPIDQARDTLVRDIVADAVELKSKLAQYKGQTFADIQAFVELSAEQYGVTLGGTKGNITLVSFDGRYKVQRQVAEHITFDERLQVAKELIDECINDWSVTSRDEIKVLINDAFRVDQEGKINTGRILGLKRLNIKNDKWASAMQAIGDSIQISGSKAYIRVYERIDGTDQYRPISLDIATV